MQDSLKERVHTLLRAIVAVTLNSEKSDQWTSVLPLDCYAPPEHLSNFSVLNSNVPFVLTMHGTAIKVD